MGPQGLPPNVLRHFYAGGARIGAFRGLDLPSDHMPEEWVAGVNTTFGAADDRGLQRLADGTLLRDAVDADPEAWLGAAHVARHGADAALLTKLLDAGERLPVHFHPGRRFAAEHLGLDHGKTEAWLILEADPGALVHLGFSRPVGDDELQGWLRDQDPVPMLAAMQAREVRRGDWIFIPGGTPHAIGAGIFLLELQEPTDLSITIEHAPFELTVEQATLGLGWETALRALDRDPWDDARVAAMMGPALPDAADPYFRAEHLQGGDALDAGFSVLLVTEGSGMLVGDTGELELQAGQTVVVPHAAGGATLDGDVTVLRCRPPAPDAPDGRW